MQLKEFAVEIPDAEADEIQTVQQGVWHVFSLCMERTT
jgi:acyl carrier protein